MNRSQDSFRPGVARLMYATMIGGWPLRGLENLEGPSHAGITSVWRKAMIPIEPRFEKLT